MTNGTRRSAHDGLSVIGYTSDMCPPLLMVRGGSFVDGRKMVFHSSSGCSHVDAVERPSLFVL